VPHLEKPDETAEAIAEFLEALAPVTPALEGSAPPTYVVGAGFFGALALSQALNLLSHSGQ
jgi:hypothetical protein